MSPANLFSSSGLLWAVNGLLVLVLGLVGFSANREIVRNDTQDTQIRSLERVCEEFRFMRADIGEMKSDMKTLLRKP